MTASEGTDTWRDAILSILKGTSNALKVKKLRKQVLISLQFDESDKAAKKTFKRTIQDLEECKEVSLDADGLVALSEKSKKRKRKEEKKAKNKQRKTKSEAETSDVAPQESGAQHASLEGGTFESTDKNKRCKGNPQGFTRLFLGNLPFAVDETSIGSFLKEKVTHIKWITDKETGKFYGSAFVEMEDSVSAAEAIAMAGQSLMGRPIKINYAPARDGQVWPPEKKVITGGTTTGGQAGGTGVKAMSEKPDNCIKLFIGNLSYDIDDDGITKFFDQVGAELKAVRWLHHKDSGDFKGCGFVEFWNSEACDKGATLNGKNLMGRPIRIDWSD